MKLAIFGISSFLVASILCVSLLAVRSQTESKTSNNVTDNYRVSGLVTDETGAPIEGARVFSMATDRPAGGRTPMAISDQNGRFIIENVNAGHNVIYAENEAVGYPGLLNIAYNGKPASADISEKVPSAEVVVQMGAKCPRLTGKVVESGSNLPIKDARVKMCLVDTPGRCFTTSINEDGTFNLLVPVEQAFTFNVASDTHKDKTLTLSSNGMASSNLVLESDEARNLTVSLDKK